MKKLVLIVVIGFIIGGCSSLNRTRSIKIKLDCCKIIIPEPFRDYINPDQEQYLKYNKDIISFKKSFFFFKKHIENNYDDLGFPDTMAQIYNNALNYSDTKNQEYNNALEYPDTIFQRLYKLDDNLGEGFSDDCSGNDYKEMTNGIPDSMSYDLNLMIAVADTFFQSNTKELNFKYKKGVVYFGHFFNNINSFYDISFVKKNYSKTKLKLIESNIYINVKGKLIDLKVVFSYYGSQSIINIKNFSESWAKAILEANK